MSELLIHSMMEFSEIILGGLEIAGASDVVEVGVGGGEMSALLLEYTRRRRGSLVAIDPAPPAEVEALFRATTGDRLLRGRSLDLLPTVRGDAWLLDGDHNYYTVLSESQRIRERCAATRRPFLAFYHHVGWPWARRDSYLDPASIPDDFVRPHTWNHGVTLDEPGVVAGGLRIDGNRACALNEGGPCNGVLTAVEDFNRGEGDRLVWAFVPAVYGLGVLFDKAAPWAGKLVAHLSPYHRNPLLARLERNRLECYLALSAQEDQPDAAVA